jgi:hypothetical protein
MAFDHWDLDWLLLRDFALVFVFQTPANIAHLRRTK